MSQPRKPAGSANSAGGQYDFNPGTGADDLTGSPNPLLQVVSQGLRLDAIREPHAVKSAEETRGLLALAAHIGMDREGMVLTDGDGRVVYRETVGSPRLDDGSLRADRRARAAIRDVLRADLSDVDANARRMMVKRAWRVAGPYERRLAIDHSPNRRYVPASSIANSLRRRRDRQDALNVLKALHYEDASASSAVIRAGYPNDPESVWGFVNYTKIQRYAKDTKDRDGVRHHKGEAIIGDYVTRSGRHVHGPLPEKRGSAARSYLRMIWQPTNGVPDKRTSDRIVQAMRSLDDTPELQAEAFWNLCYGTGSAANRDGNPGRAAAILAGRLDPGKAADRRELERLHGVADLERLSGGSGQGNAARMAAYRKCMTPEAARVFLTMEPGDNRLANTVWTRRKRNPVTGVMEDVRPARLTEMRAWIHAVYEI